MTILAIDPSLTCSGFSYTKDDAVHTGTIRTKDLRGSERLDFILDSVRSIVSKTDGLGLVVLEGYAMGGKGRVFDIGELGGVLKHTFWKDGIPVLVVPPTSLKMFAAGKGNAKKPEVIQAVADLWSYRIDKHDEADAFALMKFGEAYLNRRVLRSYDTKRRSAIEKCDLLPGKHCN